MNKSKVKSQNSFENDVNNIKYNIVGIEIQEFYLSAKLNEDPNELNFSTEIRQEYNVSANNIITTISIVVNADKVSLGKIALACIYSVENLAIISDNISLKESFSALINQITIATARGVMFGMFRGTVLHNAILPIVDILQESNKTIE